MPDGIIRDPKQNPRERNFGILYVPDWGYNLKYPKVKGQDSQCLLAGTYVDIKESDFEPLTPTQYIDGITIHGIIKSAIQIKKQLQNADKAPVVEKIYQRVGGIDGIRQAIKESGVQSDFD